MLQKKIGGAFGNKQNPIVLSQNAVYDVIFDELSRDELLTSYLGSFIRNNTDNLNESCLSFSPKSVSTGKQL